MNFRQEQFRRTLAAVLIALIFEVSRFASVSAEESLPQLLPVEICLAGNREHSLTSELMTKVQARLQSVFDALQPAHFSVKKTSQEFESWFGRHSLDALSAEQCRTFGFDRAGTTIVVGLKVTRGTYELSAVEYEREIDTLGQVRRTALVQREMIGDVAARLAVRTWTPDGVIIKREGRDFWIESQSTGAIERLIQFSRLNHVGSFQIFRSIAGNAGAQHHFYPENCLLIDRIDNGQIVAHLALPPRDQAWFARLGNDGEEYRVRLLQPVSDRVVVAVRTRETLQPGEGFSVFSSSTVLSDPERLGRWRGRTDATGELSLELGTTSPEFITVAYPGGYLTKAFIPGSGQDGLQFEVPRNDIRFESEQSLTVLEEEIDDARTMWKDWGERLKKAAESLDSASAKSVVEEARQFTKTLDWQAIQADLKKITEQCTKAGQKDLAVRSDRTSKIATALQASLKLSDFEAAEKSITLADLRRQANQAQANHQWNDLVEALQKLAAIDPQDPNAKRLLSAVRPKLQPRNAENAAARTAIEGHAAVDRIEDLLAQWGAISKTLNVLASNDDVLTLLESDKKFENWNRLAQDEATRLAAAISAASNLSPQEVDKLKNRAKQLETLLQELLVIRKKSQELVKSTFGP